MRFFFFMLFVLVSLGLIVGAAVVLWRSNGEVPQLTDARALSDWSIYEDPKGSFSVHYPSSWSATLYPVEEKMEDSLLLSPQPGVPSLTKTYFVTITRHENPDHLDCGRWIDGERRRLAIVNKDDADLLLKLVDALHPVTRVTLGANSGCRVPNLFVIENYEERYFIAHRDSVYEVRFPVADSPESNVLNPIQNNAIAEKILNSFKFL